jgi:nucleoside-diphosphate-sugar epimerase
MHVAITGGTGYVGAHIVRALLEAGHTVRLLVASTGADGAVAEALSRRGPVDVEVGDIRDDSAVERLLHGSDALIHAAGVVGTDRRREALMWAVNAYAAEHIMNRALVHGLDPVVLVSSYSALFPPPAGQPIGPDTPTAPGRSPYARTKAYADRVARRLQAHGEPIVVTYPSSVVGAPFLTAAGVTERGWRPIIRAGIAPRLQGGMQMIDVRDVAEVHVRLMSQGRGPHRYVCGGKMLTFDEMIDALEAGLGRRIRRVPLSANMFRGIGWLGDAIGGMVPLGDGLSYEAALLLTAATPTDDSQTLADLGMVWRSPRQAIIDSLGSP